ncbi:MAG: ABC transporter permease [Verrucomicrobiota bacterium]
MLSKILAVAKNELLVSVKSKAFIIGLISMPILMGGMIVVQIAFKDQVDISDRKVAIVDRSGFLFDALENSNEWRNENHVYQGSGDEGRKQVQPRFILERYEETGDLGATELALSERVRKKELFAFLIIDERVLDPEKVEAESGHTLAYHTETPTFRELPNWLQYNIHEAVIGKRFENAEMDAALVRSLNKRVDLTSLGLVKLKEDGGVEKAKKENKLQTFGVPVASLMAMFMLVMMTAPALLNQVLEEKMQKISEVLVSSVTPFELMMGKLLGIVCTALALSALYSGTAYYATVRFGVADLVSPEIYAWFIFFLVLALFIYGAIFSAVGAACSEIKDSQNLMMPVMIFLMVPMFTFSIVLQSPSGTFATLVSLFPPATPMTMMLRLAIPPGPPMWQVALSVVLTVGFTVGCVYAAGKVFRIGILSQGQAPTLGVLLKWIVSK